MTYRNPPTTPRKSATFDDYTLSEIRRAAATGIYDIRAPAPSASCRISTTYCSSAPRSRVTRSKAIASAATHR